MAIATKSKPKTTHSKKRVAAHHHHGKHYVKSYWPYIPVAVMTVGFWQFGLTPWHAPLYSATTIGFLGLAVLL